MLREFRINTDPDSGLVQGDRPYSIFVLMDYREITYPNSLYICLSG